jgi:F-type H+-transporting ATPase subunit gamma
VSDTTVSLRQQIDGATDLQSVVRTMKALAAASIGQYENSVRALADYYRTVELGLGACFRGSALVATRPQALHAGAARGVGAVVFGSDQGLVGRFNEAVAEHAISVLAGLPGTPRVWAVGERVHARLLDAGIAPQSCYAVPTSVHDITPLIGRILMDTQAGGAHEPDSELQLFYNRPAQGASYASVDQRLLPLDETWRQAQAALAWPTPTLPEVIGDVSTLARLLGEFLFVSLFRACAESLASENASRLAAMERADRNIDELLGSLRGDFHRLRQNHIDEELFEVVAGFEALQRPMSPAGTSNRG